MNANGWFNNALPARRSRSPTTTSGQPPSADRSRRTNCSSSSTTKVSASSCRPAARCIASRRRTSSRGSLATRSSRAILLELPLYQKYFRSCRMLRAMPSNRWRRDNLLGRWRFATRRLVGNCICTLPGQRGPARQRVHRSADASTTTCPTRTTCSGGYSMDHGTQPTSVDFINPAFSANSYQPSYDGQGQWSHVFSPNAHQPVRLCRQLLPRDLYPGRSATCSRLPSCRADAAST